MEARRTNALLRSIALVPHRRGLFALLAGVALGGPLKANARKRGKRSFLAPRSGVLTTAQCEVRNFAEGADFTLEIRPIDPLTAEPKEDVLASASLPNRPATGSEPLSLEAIFSPPALVEEDDGYALVVTMTGTGGNFSLMARGGNPCAGRLFVLNDEGVFETLAADMVFSATIV